MSGIIKNKIPIKILKIRTVYYVSCFVFCQLGKIYSILLIIEEVGITFSFFRAIGQCVQVKVTQLCPTVFDAVDCSLQGFFLCPWNSLGKNIEVGSVSLLQGIFPTQGLNPGLLLCRQILYHLSHQGSPRILEWVVYSFLQGIFPTQGSNGGLLHYGWILYQLSYQGSQCVSTIKLWAY